jgi:hypothetical protein
MTRFEQLPQPDAGKASSESPTPAWPVIDKPSRGFRKPAIALGVALLGLAFTYTTSIIGPGGGAPTDGRPPVAAPATTSQVPTDPGVPPPTKGTPRPSPTSWPFPGPPLDAPGGPVPTLPDETPDPAGDAEAGDCLSVTGSPRSEVARITRCAPGRYRVLRRFDDEQDPRVCHAAPPDERVYLGDGFVLCLRRF